MIRAALIVLLSCRCAAQQPLRDRVFHAPWVSCFSGSGEQWIGPKTVRTPPVASPDGALRAYAEVRAEAGGPMGCQNTVRLFAATSSKGNFREVFHQQPSAQVGSATSLAPVGWSPDGRWLLVEVGDWYYASDAGGLGILLYDRRRDTILRPHLDRLILKALKQPCSVLLYQISGFDASSRVRLELADEVDPGDTEPGSHCFRGTEEWLLDPAHWRFSAHRPSADRLTQEKLPSATFDLTGQHDQQQGASGVSDCDAQTRHWPHAET